MNGIQEVGGSIPPGSTRLKKRLGATAPGLFAFSRPPFLSLVFALLFALCLPAGLGLSASQEELFEAAAEGDLAAIARLKSAGVDLRSKDRDGWTVIMHAAYQGQAQMVERMIGEGVELDAISYYGETALMIAARQGHAAIVRLLLAAGARADIASRGETARDIAEREGFPAISAMLKERSALAGRSAGGQGFELRDGAGDILVEISGLLADQGASLSVSGAVVRVRSKTKPVRLKSVRFALCAETRSGGWDFQSAGALQAFDVLLLPEREAERRGLAAALPKPQNRSLAEYWLCALIERDDGTTAVHGARQRIGR